MRVGKFLIGCGVAAVLAGASTAQADVAISKKATANMSCSAGVCSPTAAKAVLNATDLTNMLASGDVKVTTGSGATDIVVKDSFNWTSTSRLTLDAIQSVEFDKPVTVAGTGAVTITTNDGGSGGDLLFGDKGNLTFWDANSSLIIGGSSYTLVNDIATLASDIANNPSGFYALANDYDASVDGTYGSAPITTTFTGIFEGLGHQVERITIQGSGLQIGLFAEAGGELRDIAVIAISMAGSGDAAGGLVAFGDNVTIVNCVTSGKIALTSGPLAGGLVAAGSGTITSSRSAVNIRVLSAVTAGGLVGSSEFNISRSYATGDVDGGSNSSVGGLVGQRSIVQGAVTQSYATGNVAVGENSNAGGLVGLAGGTASITNSYAEGKIRGTSGNIGGYAGQIGGVQLHSSYSTGHVKGGSYSGGFIGSTTGSDDLGSDYWDTDTSGKRRGQGVGHCQDPNCGRAVKGLTTEEFQSGLPPGFDPNIWAEKKNVNDGFPFLLSMPQK